MISQNYINKYGLVEIIIIILHNQRYQCSFFVLLNTMATDDDIDWVSVYKHIKGKRERPKLSIEDLFGDKDDKKTKKKKNKKTKVKNIVDIEGFEKIEKKYNLILADPPWKYDRTHGVGIAENKYPVLDTSDIMKIPVWKIAAEDCVLLLWVTNPKIKDGLDVMEAWKFAYKNFGFVWVKISKKGDIRKLLGCYTRGCSETCYLGIKGNGLDFFEKFDSVAHADSSCYLGVRGRPLKKFQDVEGGGRGVSSYIETYLELDAMDVIYAGVTKHSEKPMHLLIDKLKQFFGPNYDTMNKIELFSRKCQVGWDCWGNECGKHNDGNEASIKGYLTWDQWSKREDEIEAEKKRERESESESETDSEEEKKDKKKKRKGERLESKKEKKKQKKSRDSDED